jgi:hypothetical protein
MSKIYADWHYDNEQRLTDLNKALISDLTLKTYALSKGGVHAYIGDLITPLCDWIAKTDVVVGCVAWMTHPVVLSALATKHCQIIVQKEDWLRPDSDNSFDRLRSQYDMLDSDMCNWEYGLNYCSYFDIEPVRCVGMHNHLRSSAFPRMHHKFLVFCKMYEGVDEDGHPYRKRHPFAVWTGSFNITNNGTNSRENAVVIEDEDIATIYYDEWVQMLALSEPLNWKSTWVTPQFRHDES